MLRNHIKQQNIIDFFKYTSEPAQLIKFQGHTAKKSRWFDPNWWAALDRFWIVTPVWIHR